MAADLTRAGFPRTLPGSRRQPRLAKRIAMVAPAAVVPGRSARMLKRGKGRGLADLRRRLFDPVLDIDRRLASDEQMPLVPSLVAGAAAGAATWAVLSYLLGTGGILPWLAALFASVMAARAVVTGRRDAVLARMEEQFELALGVIIRCVRAGLPVNEGMRAVALEIGLPTGPEFRHAVDQMQLGTGFDAALKGLADRCSLADYRFFATAVALQRQTGGNLSETLENLADTMRKRRAVRLKAKALTSETRATVVVLAILPVVVAGVLMLINPGYIMQLVDNAAGRRLLGVAIVVQMIGLAVIRSISRRTLG